MTLSTITKATIDYMDTTTTDNGASVDARQALEENPEQALLAEAEDAQALAMKAQLLDWLSSKETLTDEQVQRAIRQLAEAGPLAKAEVFNLVTAKTSLLKGDLSEMLKREEKRRKAFKDDSLQTHAQVARDYTAQLDAALVSDEGQICRLDTESHIWVPQDNDLIEKDIVLKYDGMTSACDSGGDYRECTRQVYVQNREKDFFAEAPDGLATAGRRFYRVQRDLVNGGYVLKDEHLLGSHRQRAALAFKPDFLVPPLQFLDFLDESFDGTDADAQIQVLQEAYGLAIMGLLPRFKKALLQYGPTNSGKSVTLGLITSLLPSAMTAAIDLTRLSEDGVMATLVGVSLAHASELSSVRDIPGGHFKQITGGEEPVSCKRLFKDRFEFVVRAGLVANANRLPGSDEGEPAFFKRWLALHFPNSKPEQEQDLGLMRRLREEEGPQIIGWLMQGAVAAMTRGYIEESSAGRGIVREWQLGRDSVKAFLVERTEAAEGAKVSMREVRDAYQRYCRDEQLGGVKTIKKLTQRLVEHGLKVTNPGNVPTLHDVRLTQEATQSELDARKRLAEALGRSPELARDADE